jgi:hypothetical protein
MTESARRRRAGDPVSQHLTNSGRELDQMRPFALAPLG